MKHTADKLSEKWISEIPSFAGAHQARVFRCHHAEVCLLFNTPGVGWCWYYFLPFRVGRLQVSLAPESEIPNEMVPLVSQFAKLSANLLLCDDDGLL